MTVDQLALKIANLSRYEQHKLAEQLVLSYPIEAERFADIIDAVAQDQQRLTHEELVS